MLLLGLAKHGCRTRTARKKSASFGRGSAAVTSPAVESLRVGPARSGAHVAVTQLQGTLLQRIRFRVLHLGTKTPHPNLSSHREHSPPATKEGSFSGFFLHPRLDPWIWRRSSGPLLPSFYSFDPWRTRRSQIQQWRARCTDTHVLVGSSVGFFCFFSWSMGADRGWGAEIQIFRCGRTRRRRRSRRTPAAGAPGSSSWS